MLNFQVLNRRFSPSWLMVFLAGLGFILFTSLGFWQLQRAETKRQMIAQEKLQAKGAQVIFPSENLPKQYQRMRVTGQYLKAIFLLDNQHYQHQFGFHVISPLQLQDGSVLFIDRGWVPGDRGRMVFPSIRTPQKNITLSGSAYYPSKPAWVLGPILEKKQDNLTITEHLDIKKMSKLLQKRSYPFIMRLEKAAPLGFIREWVIVSQPPARHVAYALQWFAFALVVIILFFSLNSKKI